MCYVLRQSQTQTLQIPILWLINDCCFSVTESCWDSLRSHELQHTRLPCPSLSPRVCSDSCALSQWCYLTISSSAAHFSFCFQSVPASGPFPMSRFFTLGGPKYWGFSNSPSNEYSELISFRISWFEMLALQGTLKSLLQQHKWKHQFFSAQPSLWSNSYIYIWLLENLSF